MSDGISEMYKREEKIRDEWNDRRAKRIKEKKDKIIDKTQHYIKIGIAVEGLINMVIKGDN